MECLHWTDLKNHSHYLLLHVLKDTKELPQKELLRQKKYECHILHVPKDKATEFCLRTVFLLLKHFLFLLKVE